jgi:hypothetical protein
MIGEKEPLSDKRISDTYCEPCYEKAVTEMDKEDLVFEHPTPT